MDPYVYFFIRLLSDFFSFFCQDANKARSNRDIIGCTFSKKHKLALYKAQKGEPNYEIISFSLIFIKSYSYKTLGTDNQIL